jgi:hypothetical protein
MIGGVVLMVTTRRTLLDMSMLKPLKTLSETTWIFTPPLSKVSKHFPGGRFDFSAFSLLVPPNSAFSLEGRPFARSR